MYKLFIGALALTLVGATAASAEGYHDSYGNRDGGYQAAGYRDGGYHYRGDGYRYAEHRGFHRGEWRGWDGGGFWRFHDHRDDRRGDYYDR